jgi:hypothetical protein
MGPKQFVRKVNPKQRALNSEICEGLKQAGKGFPWNYDRFRQCRTMIQFEAPAGSNGSFEDGSLCLETCIIIAACLILSGDTSDEI